MAPAGPMPGYGQPPMEQPLAPGPFVGGAAQSAGAAPQSGPDAGFPFIQTEPPSAPAASTTAPPEPPAATATPPAQPAAQEEKKEPRIVRSPCPQGHELQTPMDMVNQEVLCPVCGTQFYLRYEDSIEFKQEQAELRRRKAEHLNQAALKWSIVAAVVIVLTILGMIVYLAMRAPREENYLPREDSTEPTATEPADESAAPDDKEAGSPEKTDSTSDRGE